MAPRKAKSQEPSNSDLRSAPPVDSAELVARPAIAPVDVQTPIVRVQLIREGVATTPVDEPPIPALIQAMLGDADREKLMVIYLDAQANVLATEMAAVGALNLVYVQPRDIFKGALLANATAIVLAHGHPGGEAFPSQDDLNMTRRLIRAGEIMEIPVWDHFILGSSNKLVSMRETTSLWDS